MNKLLTSVLVIGLVSGIGFALTRAFFSDTETSAGNTFAAGAVDLYVGNDSYYNGSLNEDTSWPLQASIGTEKFFDFNDIKPGDDGEDTLELQVQTNDAWACAEIVVTQDNDNTCTGPEELDDLSCAEPNDDDFDGEVGGLVEYILWIDDGDNVLEDNEATPGAVLADGVLSDLVTPVSVALADSVENNLGEPDGNPMIGNKSYYLGKGWCFGTMALTPVTQDGFGNVLSPIANPGFTCDGSGLNNASQTDVLQADISFNVEQARNNPNFVCGEPEVSPTPSTSPTPTPLACVPQASEVFASSSVSLTQGTKKSGAAVDANRSIAANALGAPTAGVPNPPEWVSLGYGGTMVIEFASPVHDGPGDDISIHEVTGGRASYPLESATVEVSADNSIWYAIGTATSEPAGDGVTYFDIDDGIGAPDQITYVRVKDTTNAALHDNLSDGFDLDAVDGVYGACVQPEN